LDYTNIRPKAKGEKMNKRIILGSLLVLAVLAVAFFVTNRVSALRPSGSTGNQVFYSPSIAALIPPAPPAAIRNQVFYSSFVASLIEADQLSAVPDQAFTSGYTENLIKRGSTGGIPNQVFYSPAVEGFVH
jgi:hypothetical protein